VFQVISSLPVISTGVGNFVVGVNSVEQFNVPVAASGVTVRWPGGGSGHTSANPALPPVTAPSKPAQPVSVVRAFSFPATFVLLPKTGSPGLNFAVPFEMVHIVPAAK